MRPIASKYRRFSNWEVNVLAMINDLRFKRLERAKLAGLAGEYEAAYHLLDVLLAQAPDDIEARRLYGNILEMHAFSEETDLPMDARLRGARIHYRHIIKIGSGNLLAIFDLAEHFANIGRIQFAGRLFRRFAELHQQSARDEFSDELDEAESWLKQFGVLSGQPLTLPSEGKTA